MSNINSIIQPFAFEVIRDRLAEIIIDEVSNQYTITSDSDLMMTVFVERATSIDLSEMPAINVTLARGSYDGRTAKKSIGSYQYNIDVYTSAKDNGIDYGDSLAAIKLHKLLRVVYAIIENPVYSNLGFQRPFISERKIDEIIIQEPNRNDAGFTIMGRLAITVKVAESMILKTPVLLAEHETQVKIGSTDIGYKYFING